MTPTKTDKAGIAVRKQDRRPGRAANSARYSGFQRSPARALVGAAALLGATSTGLGQYALAWWTVEGGGGTSAGGVYTLTGVVGQADAGTMAGGAFLFSGGFWPAAGGESPLGEPPQLTIANLGAGGVQVCWPSPSPGWVLQQSPELSPAAWTNSILEPSVQGTNRCVTIAPPNGRLFLRLARPS
jgi:hypothetical protein